MQVAVRVPVLGVVRAFGVVVLVVMVLHRGRRIVVSIAIRMGVRVLVVGVLGVFGVAVFVLVMLAGGCLLAASRELSSVGPDWWSPASAGRDQSVAALPRIPAVHFSSMRPNFQTSSANAQVATNKATMA